MEKKSLYTLSKSGVEIVGNITGALAGLAIAGTEGAVVGASIPPILNNLFNKLSYDILNRKLSKREESKIGAGYLFAIERINRNNELGKEIVNEIFNDNDNLLSDSNAILENVTIKLQKEWELKKLQYYGNFLGNIAFTKEVDFNYSTVLLKIAESLSYRQLCIIKIFKDKGIPEINLTLINNKYGNINEDDNFNYSLYSDLVELEKISVLKRLPPYSLGATLGNCKLSKIGISLYELMNLEDIEEKDCNQTLNEFNRMLPTSL